MNSRVPTYLHPVAGRPMIWHTLQALMSLDSHAEQVIVVMPEEFHGMLPDDVHARVVLVDSGNFAALKQGSSDGPCVVLRASAFFDHGLVASLLASDEPQWLGCSSSGAIGLTADETDLRKLAMLKHDEWQGVGVCLGEGGFPVVDRNDLVRMQRAVRDRLVKALMEGGATFLLPETTLVDVDVQIGRDTIVYPGAILEGQTTIGEETVIGPGCRIIDSWVGSGVELKGWNYISHASVRNRAILEPYVRRGFD